MMLFFFVIGFVLAKSTQRDQEALYRQWNIMFKNELQTELQVEQPNQQKQQGPPQDQDTPQNRMNQILYEQEEQMEKIKMKISAEKEQKRLEDEKELERQKKDSENRWGQSRGDTAQGGDNYSLNGDEGGADSRSGAGVAAIKPLQRQQSEGNIGEGMDQAHIVLVSNIHKLAFVLLLLTTLLLLALMREFYCYVLKKFFRKALQNTLLDNSIVLLVLLISVCFYYYGIFDQFYLISRDGSSQVVSGIRMIQLRQQNTITVQDTYDIDVYVYLMMTMAYFLVMLVLHIYYILRFNFQFYLYDEAEDQWNKKEQLCQLYDKALAELEQRRILYERLMGYPRRPPQIDQLIDQMKEIQAVLIDVRFTVEYFCMKKSFLQNPPTLLPYMGPCALRDDFNFSEYMARVSAKTLLRLNLYKPLMLVGLVVQLALMGFVFWVLEMWINPLVATLAVMFICHGLSFYMLIEFNYILSTAYAKVILNVDNQAQALQVLTQNEAVWFPTFLQDSYDEKVPTPDMFAHGPRGPQNLLFIQQSPQFTLYLISFTLKSVIATDFFVFACIFLYFRLGWISCTIIMISILWYTWVVVTNLLPKILMKLIKTAHIEMLRDYDLIYEVIKDHKIDLGKACQHFYEFGKYLRRFTLSPLKESLILHRSFLLEPFLDALQYFQGSGVGIIPHPDRPAQELEMLETGINERDLGLHLPPSVMPGLCQVMGITDIDSYEMMYMINFSQIQPINGIAVADQAKYISPLRLLLFIQLRTQEVMQPQKQVLREALMQIIRFKFDPIAQDQIPTRLITGERPEKKEARKQKPEDGEESSDQDEEEKKEEEKIGIANFYIIDDSFEVMEKLMDRQFQENATVDIDDLDECLSRYCELQLFNEAHKDLLIKELRYLSKTQLLTLDRLVEFISNQIDMKPY